MIKPLVLINHRDLFHASGKPAGISNFMFSLAAHLLDRSQVRLGLVTSWRQEDVPPHVLERLAIFEQHHLIRPRVLDVALQARSMRRLAEAVGADAILNMDPTGTPAGAPFLATIVHDLYFKVLREHYSLKVRFASEVITRMVLSGSDAIICVSDTTRRDVVSCYPRLASRTTRVYPDAATTGLPAPPGLDEPRRRHVLWIGNMTPNKNVACLYEALAKLAGRGIQTDVVVVGRDPLGLGAAAERHLCEGVRLTRVADVSSDDLRRLYAEALVFVNTSLYEGFGIPVIEAQRAGIPVVCSTGGAVAEVAGAGALSFDPRDSDQLAGHLERVLTDRSLRQALVAAGHLNAGRFSWARTAEEIETVLLDGVARTKGRAVDSPVDRPTVAGR